MILFANATTGGTSQIKQLNAIEHIVAPATLLLEGVQYHPINGQIWPVLAPANEILMSTEAWNNVGITVGHPIVNGRHALLSSPETFEQFHIGELFNVQPVEQRGIHGEIWLNTERAKTLGGDAAQLAERLRSNIPTENSTGYLANILEQSGTFNGIPYAGIQTAIRPNHHALLLNGIGQCSLADGCGVFNCATCGTTSEEMMKIQNMELPTLQKFAALLGITNVMDYLETITAVERKLIALEGWEDFRGLIVVDDERVVYAKDVDNVKVFFERAYTVSETNVLTFGEPEQVAMSFVPIENEKPVETQPVVSINAQLPPQTAVESKEVIPMDRETLVNQLIANTEVTWGEDDRPFLTSLTEEQFDKIFVVEEEVVVATNQTVVPTTPTPEQTPNQQPAAAPATLVETTQVNLGQMDTAQMQNMVIETVAKTGLIEQLLANEKFPFTREDLMAKPLAELKALQEWAASQRPQPQVNFRGRQLPVNPQQQPQKFEWDAVPGERSFGQQAK